MIGPVTAWRIAIASRYLSYPYTAAKACRAVKMPYYVACALLEQESGGRNIYGHDPGGVFSVNYDKYVTKENFAQFFEQVCVQGHTSNGVGPCQLTYPGFFTDMEKKGLRPWVPYDNMVYGFGLLAAQNTNNDWRMAYARYNGGPNPNSTALSNANNFLSNVVKWKRRLRV